MKIIGITGSIGCGKTTLANIAQGLGYGVYYTDGATRRFYYQKDFIDIIDKNFSDVVAGGRVDKRALRKIVFNDRKALRRLEALVHPLLQEDLKRVIRKNAQRSEMLFIDAAILFELGWDKFCDLIILADVDYKIQKKRVMERDKILAEEFDKINDLQMDNKAKAALADVVVNTDQPMNQLRAEMITIMRGMSW